MTDPNKAFLLSSIRLPAKRGLGYITDSNMKRRVFSFAAIQRYANKQARKSLIPNAVGLVSDQDTYWRVNVAGQPEDYRS